MTEIKQLETFELYQRCNPDQFDFETTAELEPLEQVVGQPRLHRAFQRSLPVR